MNINSVTKEELIKAIHRECVSCCGRKEEKIYYCEMITCPFHIYISLHTVEPVVVVKVPKTATIDDTPKTATPLIKRKKRNAKD